MTEQLWAIEQDSPLDGPLHPYLRIYQLCRRFGTPVFSADGSLITIIPALPQSGSVLDQDAELMLAFEILDETMHQIEAGREARKKNMELAAQRGGTAAVPTP